MKRLIIFLFIIFMTLLAACGETKNNKPNDGKESLKIFSNKDTKTTSEEKENIEEESIVEEPQKFVEDDDDEEEEEEQSISPFPTTIASFDIPPDVLNIIKNEPRKPNITNFIVDLGGDSLFIQNAYKIIEEVAWRNNYYGVHKKENNEIVFVDLFETISENTETSEMFPSSTPLTERNISLQVFGNYVFLEMFDKDYGKQYVGINYLTGDMTEAIDINDLDTNTSIIFGSNYFYYVAGDYLHRVNYITQTDEQLFYMKGPNVDIYAAGRVLCDLHQNRFSLAGNQLIFACSAPRWRKIVDPEKEGEFCWAEGELEESDSILNCLKAEGINLESDIDLFHGNCDIDEEIKKHGAYELGYDMKATGYEYSCDADMVLAIDLDTGDLRVLSYQVGDFYKAYAIDNQILIDASSVYDYYVSYSGDETSIKHPSEVQIHNVNQEIVTQQLLGDNVQSINQSEFMPPERAEKKGYVAYSANVLDTNSNNQGKQVISYDGETVPLSNIHNLSCMEVLRISIRLGLLLDDSSMFYPVNYTYVWDESTQGFIWKDEN